MRDSAYYNPSLSANRALARYPSREDPAMNVRTPSTQAVGLDAELPESHDRALFSEKNRALYDLLLDYSAKRLKWTA